MSDQPILSSVKETTRIEEQHHFPFSHSSLLQHLPTSENAVWTIFINSPYYEDGLEYTIHPKTPNSPYYLIYKWINKNTTISTQFDPNSNTINQPLAPRREILRVYYMTGVQPQSPLERHALSISQTQQQQTLQQLHKSNQQQQPNELLFLEEEEWRKMQDGVQPGTILSLPDLYHSLYTKFLSSVDVLARFSDTLRLLHEINTTETNSKIALEEKKKRILKNKSHKRNQTNHINGAVIDDDIDTFLDDSNITELVRTGDDMNLIQHQLTNTIHHFDFDLDFT